MLCKPRFVAIHTCLGEGMWSGRDVLEEKGKMQTKRSNKLGVRQEFYLKGVTLTQLWLMVAK